MSESESEPVVSFLEKVRKVAAEQADTTFACWYSLEGDETNSCTFKELWDEAGLIAYHLRQVWEVKQGENVLLCYDFGLNFIASFLGCLRAGVVAVLVYPPFPPLTKTLPKMIKNCADCHPRLILTDSRVTALKKLDLLNPLSKSRNMWPTDIDWKDTSSLRNVRGSSRGPSVIALFRQSSVISRSFDEEGTLPGHLAFLQYTSGSTGDPKGVMITHGALSHNVQLIRDQLSYRCEMLGGVEYKELSGFSWLPQYHDMGLLVILTALSSGNQMHLLSPIAFIRKPTLWMELASRHKVNCIFGPNFSYDLVARKFREMKDKAPPLDLSRIRLAMYGAEPVRQSTIDSFEATFKPFGFFGEYTGVAYGLAETVVFASIGYGNRTSKVNPSLLAVGNRAQFFSSNIKIVDPETFIEMQDESIGEVWISGPSIAAGYYGKTDLSEQVFRAKIIEESHHDSGTTDDIEINLTSNDAVTYLRTGDLGFFENDDLYICGRMKDLIIVNGANQYPQDIEFAVQEASPAVRPGCIAAFSKDECGDDAGFEIVFEIRKAHEHEVSGVCRQVHAYVAVQLGLSASRIVAIPERTICKTTSGKIQRRACRTNLHTSVFKILGEYCPNIRIEPKVVEEESPALKHKSGKPVLRLREFSEVTEEFFDTNVDQEATWEELGLTSLASIEFKAAIERSFPVVLPPDVFDTHTTPRQLEELILSFHGEQINISLDELKPIKSLEIPWFLCHVLQALGSLILVLLFAVPIIPAFYVGKYVSLESTRETFKIGNSYVWWMWLPLTVPTWMLSFTVLVIASKWVVVGRYQRGKMAVPSLAFVRWWFVDRAVHLFEFWIGRFIQDTPLIWLVYFLMGARIHPSASIEAFIREFDLVKIGSSVSLKHRLRCRKFTTWTKENGLQLHFRSTHLDNNCQVKGMVCPGAHIEEGATILKHSVVPEGGKVPTGSIAVGNPAFIQETSKVSQRKSNWLGLGILKVSWLVLELYLFFSSILVAQIVWNDMVPAGWYYTSLLHWALLITTSAFVSLCFGILLKWTFIGRRRHGMILSDSLLRIAMDWMVDYHFRICTSLLTTFASSSIFWNVVLKLCGMDIDFSSKVYINSFPPSAMDLITVKDSFISVATFEAVKADGRCVTTTVKKSSIGHNAHIGPGVFVSNSVVPPLAVVLNDMSKEKVDPRYDGMNPASVTWLKVAVEMCFAIFLVTVFLSLIPSYRLWKLLDPKDVWIAVPVLAACMVTQSLVWIVLLRVIQLSQTCFGFCSVPFLPIYAVYVSASWSVQNWTLLPVVWGTPFFNIAAQLLGAKMGGRVMYFGYSLHDFDQLSFADRTIIDGAFAFGHTMVFGDASFGPNVLSGLYHESSFVAMAANPQLVEFGPSRVLLGAGTSSTMLRKKGKSKGFEAGHPPKTSASPVTPSSGDSERHEDVESGLSRKLSFSVSPSDSKGTVIDQSENLSVPNGDTLPGQVILPNHEDDVLPVASLKLLKIAEKLDQLILLEGVDTLRWETVRDHFIALKSDILTVVNSKTTMDSGSLPVVQQVGPNKELAYEPADAEFDPVNLQSEDEKDEEGSDAANTTDYTVSPPGFLGFNTTADEGNTYDLDTSCAENFEGLLGCGQVQLTEMEKSSSSVDDVLGGQDTTITNGTGTLGETPVLVDTEKHKSVTLECHGEKENFVFERDAAACHTVEEEVGKLVDEDSDTKTDDELEEFKPNADGLAKMNIAETVADEN